MNRTFETIISVIACIVLFPMSIILMIMTSVQHSMTKEDYRVKCLKRASYKELKDAMLSVKWVFDNNFPYSLFTEDYFSSEFHASIFRIGEVGYLMTPYGIIMANILQRKLRRTAIGYTAQRGKPFIQ